MEDLLSMLKKSQLKELAARYVVDESGLKTKSDYVRALSGHPLITRGEVEEFIHDKETEDGPEPFDALDGDTGEEDEADVDGDADAPPKADSDGGQGEDGPKTSEVDDLIEDAVNKEASLADAQDLMTQTRDHFRKEEYEAAIQRAKQALVAFNQSYEEFQTVGISYALASSQRVLDGSKAVGLDAQRAEDLLRRAKNYLNDKNYAKVGTIIDQLDQETVELHKQQAGRTGDFVRDIEAKVEDAKDMGVDTSEAERLCAEAKGLLESDFYLKAIDAARRAERSLSASQDARTKELLDSVPDIESIIEEARALGSDVSEAAELLDEAKDLFAVENYAEGAEAAQRAEALAQELLQKQIQKALELKERLAGRKAAPQAAAGPSAAQPSQQTGSQTAQPGTQPAQADQAGQQQTAQSHPCSLCGKALTWVQQYGRWYCYSCGKYA